MVVFRTQLCSPPLQPALNGATVLFASLIQAPICGTLPNRRPGKASTEDAGDLHPGLTLDFSDARPFRLPLSALQTQLGLRYCRAERTQMSAGQ